MARISRLSVPREVRDRISASRTKRMQARSNRYAKMRQPVETGKSLGAQRKIAEMQQIKTIPYVGAGGSKAVKLSSPSWYMGMKTVPKWVAEPTATYKVKGDGTVKMYAWPQDPYRYYVHPDGEVVKVTRKGEIYQYPEGLYEGAPYKELDKVPSWLEDIV